MERLKLSPERRLRWLRPVMALRSASALIVLCLPAVIGQRSLNCRP